MIKWLGSVNGLSMTSKTVDVRNLEGNSEKEDNSQVGILGAFLTLAHIYSRSEQDRNEEPSYLLWFKLISKLILTASFMAMAGGALFLTNIHLFPAAVSALQASNLAAFKPAVVLAGISYIISGILKVVSFYNYDKFRENLIFKIRARLIENASEKGNIRTIQVERFQNVLTKVVENVVAHAPVILYMLLLSAVQIPYALKFLDVRLLVVSFLVSMLATVITKKVKKSFDASLAEHKENEQQWQTRLQKNLRQVNTVSDLSHENNFMQVVQSDLDKERGLATQRYGYDRLYDVAKILCEKLSMIITLSCLAFLLFSGFVELSYVAVMLPICSEMSKCIGTFAGAAGMSSKLITDMKMLREVWQESASGSDQIPVMVDTTTAVNQNQFIGSSALIVAVFAYVLSGITLAAYVVSGAASVLFLAQSVEGGIIGRLCNHLVALNAYFWGGQAIMVGGGAKKIVSEPYDAEDLDSDDPQMTGEIFFGTRQEPQSFTLNVGKMTIIKAGNGTGKSLIYAQTVPGKCQRIGEPFFKSTRAWVLNKTVGAIDLGCEKGDNTVLEELTARFHVSQNDKSQFRDKLLARLESVLHDESECAERMRILLLKQEGNDANQAKTAKFSYGETQLLVLLAAMSALEITPGAVDYICIDEMTNNIDESRKEHVLHQMVKFFANWRGTTTVIEQTDIEFKKAEYQQAYNELIAGGKLLLDRSLPQPAGNPSVQTDYSGWSKKSPEERSEVIARIVAA